jgi:hypothetical protein
VIRTPPDLFARLDAKVQRRREAYSGTRVGRADVARALLFRSLPPLSTSEGP